MSVEANINSDRWSSVLDKDKFPSAPIKNSGYVFVVRHGHGTHIGKAKGEGFFNASLVGPKQAKLTDLGKKDAEDAAKDIQKLVDGEFLAFVSPLHRTVDTFDILQKNGVRITSMRKEEAVIEMGAGPLEGEVFDMDIANNPVLWPGETQASVESRVLNFVKSILLSSIDKQNALIVTHQAVMEAFEPKAAGARPGEIRVYSKNYLLSLLKEEKTEAKSDGKSETV